ncbi:MAG: GNAT family N-acetyltransferase [Patescibacteria group bacterium]|nr:GNAT family N-acetyltransferase [Patescibacteria group bacterium]
MEGYRYSELREDDESNPLPSSIGKYHLYWFKAEQLEKAYKGNPSLIEYFLEYLAQTVNKDSHMLQVNLGGLIESVMNNQAVMFLFSDKFTDKKDKKEGLSIENLKLGGFARLFPWQKEQEDRDKVIAWEIGTVFVTPELRGNHLAECMIEALINHMMNQIGMTRRKPIFFAVVTEDNEASKKLFSRLVKNGEWREEIPTEEQTQGFTVYLVGEEGNYVNVFEGWGIPSRLYFYNR